MEEVRKNRSSCTTSKYHEVLIAVEKMKLQVNEVKSECANELGTLKKTVLDMKVNPF